MAGCAWPGPAESARGKLIAVEQLALYLELQLTSVLIAEHDLAYRPRRRPQRRRHRHPPTCRRATGSSSRQATTMLSPESAPVDVPSDGAFHNLALVASAAKTSPLRVVVPRESPDVFRLARLEQRRRAPAAAGAGGCVRRGRLPAHQRHRVHPAGQLCRYRPRCRSGGQGGAQTPATARSQQASSRARCCCITRSISRSPITAAVAIDIEVRERVPVLRDDEDDIKLELGKVSPAWEPYEPKPAEQTERLRGGLSLAAAARRRRDEGAVCCVHDSHRGQARADRRQPEGALR